MRHLIQLSTVMSFSALLFSAGCQSNPKPTTNPAAQSPSHALYMADAPSPLASVTSAIAVLQPLSDSHVAGKVMFAQTPAGVEMVADVTGLTPGKHGFHIHEFGDLSDPKGASAGGHYNPEGEMHGLPSSPHHQAGDMGNIDADAEGKAHMEFLLAGATIAGDKDPILGRSVIIHEKEDDGTPPTGNAGGRIAGGVIGVAQKK